MGKFFAFDGIDRSGKTTTLKNVAQLLREKDVPIREVCGGSIAGHRIVDFVGRYPDEVVYMLLWQSHRLLDLVDIRPLLESGKVVLCGRYILSNLAHNWWTDLDPQFQSDMASIYIERFTLPDVYFVFTIPFRVFSKRDDGDSPMDETLFYKLQAGYVHWGERLAKSGACDVVFVRGTLSEDAVSRLVLDRIERELEEA